MLELQDAMKGDGGRNEGDRMSRAFSGDHDLDVKRGTTAPTLANDGNDSQQPADSMDSTGKACGVVDGKGRRDESASRMFGGSLSVSQISRPLDQPGRLQLKWRRSTSSATPISRREKKKRESMAMTRREYISREDGL